MNEKINDAEIRKEALAKEVIDRWGTFQVALSDKRKYPATEFMAFAKSVRHYVKRLAVTH
jgi:hypothetical protein